MTLEKAIFDVSIIEYGNLREEMTDRIERIKTLSQEPGKHLLVDEDMKISILEEFKPRAREIFAEIKNMRLQNKNTEAFMTFSIDILKKYNIPIIVGKDDLPYSANLENVRIQENAKLHRETSHLQEDFLNKKINAATFEKTTKTHEKAYADRVAEVVKAKDELQKFIDSLPTGA